MAKDGINNNVLSLGIDFSKKVVLALGLFVAFVVSPAALQAETRYVEGEAIVTFKQSATVESTQRKLKGRSLAMAKRFELVSRQRNRQVGLVRSSEKTTSQLIADLQADPDVESAEPNYLRWISKARPNDPYYASQWALENTGQTVGGTTGVSGADIDFSSAWALVQTNSALPVVAVIDSGLDCSHPDLLPSLWINTQEIPANSIDDDGNGYADDYYGYDFAVDTGDVVDSGEHGTHVSGTIAAAASNSIGVVGVNPLARIMALKGSTDGDTFSSDVIIEAIQYATMMKNRGVNVVAINASFGGGGSNSVERAAIQAAGNAGIVFCAAAGNSTLNHDSTADYPSSYRLPNMIVIAASTSSDTMASFSDYGASTVDLAAPGANILSTVPATVSSSVSVGSSSYAATRMTYSGLTSGTGISGVLYDCGFGFPTNFAAAVRGNIALISRGSLYFSEKVANAAKAGAAAVIIYNNTSGVLNGTLQYGNSWPPAVTISQADGLLLKAALPANATVNVSLVDSQSFALMSGTSMATPHVSGAVAFAAMNFPGETAVQRVQRVLSNVDTVAGFQGRVRTGGRLNLLRLVDTDRNNLPDWWEQRYFGRILGALGSTEDADGDGASDLAEWTAGTDPINASSSLRARASSSAGAGGITLTWPSTAGRTYRVLKATDLASGFTQVVRSNIMATPPMNTETGLAGANGSSGFYRIEIE